MIKVTEDGFTAMMKKKFDKNDWANMHDCVVDATYAIGPLSLNQEQLEELFLTIPGEMKVDAFKWGMNDTPWRDNFIAWYVEHHVETKIEVVDVEEQQEEGISEININIWDDFFEDGYVPEGEIQETYAYIEDDVPHDYSKQFLTAMFDYMNDYLNIKDDGVTVEMFFYESSKKFPSLVGTEYEFSLFDRWEIRFKNLTHKRLDKLVEELNEAKFEYEGVPFKIYSES